MTPRIPLLRHCLILGRPAIAHWRFVGGSIDCSLNGEYLTGSTTERRHDLWHPCQVVLGERI